MSRQHYYDTKRFESRWLLLRERIRGNVTKTWADLDAWASGIPTLDALYKKMIDDGFKYEPDPESDRWEHPLHFFSAKKGDCDDWARFLLEVLGLSDILDSFQQRARIVYVKYALDGSSGPIPAAHAIVAVELDKGGPWTHISSWGVCPYERPTLDELLRVTPLEAGEHGGYAFSHFEFADVLDATLHIERTITK